ncbi:acyl-CoA dehydrogenase family protein [Acidovorax sp. CCYZU-2555]|uniref:acyl-CoA dehydrogenase family protein n=1 Tax=Acidovorax sp. CCYZU-2555 TaxID=2835042 RepID=UPI001BD1ABE0|nr:acyl-CoA dehydrogenase family protein [Acidovorax sp. CCYZU-2555]MBS7778803.1 acyl-CoA dehydrogenase family protein [Acidovorax sp. CCYZU-2555]
MTQNPTLSAADPYAAFREELLEFTRQPELAALKEKVRSNQKMSRAEYSAWQKALHARGWGAPNWPVEYGGTGWDLQQRYLFEEVTAQADCPPAYHHGIGHIGPVIMHFGSDAIKERFLPRILDGSEHWCQGYSEPGAGSDLASLKTTAVRDGDDYVLNGQKIWTSHAQEADMMYTLVRTSNEGRKQAGISLLLVPLDTPGIEVRAIHTIDQWHHVNEVFLNDVRVPVKNLVGVEGEGWKCAKFLLDRERLSPATVPRLARQLEQVAELLARKMQAHPGLPSIHALQERLFLAQASTRGARQMLLSAIQEEMQGTLASSKSSALKLHTSELSQQIVGIAFDIAGPEYAARLVPEVAAPDGSDDLDIERQLTHTYLFYRSRTIAGGTSEVQKNVIARDLFGA